MQQTPRITINNEEIPSSVESWWRTQSATMALLKHTHARMESAERRLAEQEARIRQLEDLASTDPLTALMNRRGFEKFFTNEVARMRRHDGPLFALLVLIDLDGMKAINDTYGHAAGDACLVRVAEILSRFIRTLDGAARLGGDEFALLLTQADTDKAMKRIETLRKTLDRLTINWMEGGDMKQLPFGASVGTETVTITGDYALSTTAADKKLYADKQRRKAQTPR